MITQRCCTPSSVARQFPSRHTAFPDHGRDGVHTARYHLIAVLEFDDEVALGNAMSSPEGQAAVADMANFAGAGATTLTGKGQTLV